MIKPIFFNVLITSLSKKVSLIRAVRRALEKMSDTGRVIGADSNPMCVGRYFVDAFWEMPPTGRLEIEEIVDFCTANDIRSIIPTRDGELLFFAENKEIFDANGIAVMIASPESVHTCLDKKAFFRKLESQDGLNPITTLDRPDRDQGEKWVVKERFGAGSKNISLNLSFESASAFSRRYEDPIYQPYIEGQEYSVDLFISQNGVPKGCIPRKRDLVVDGESQVATTDSRPDIEAVCLKAADILGLTGHVLFQLIEDSFGEVHIVECNCRFGGTSSLSVAAGLESFYWFFLECLGDDLSDITFVHSRFGLRQIRYPEDRILQVSEE